MIDPKEKEILAKGLQFIWIFWSAMFASLGIYIIAPYMIGDQIKIQELSPDVFSFLRNTIYVVSAIELAIIPFVRKSALKSINAQQVFSRGIPGTENHPAVAKYASVVIVTLAITGSVSIYGMVLYFLGKDSQSLYILTAISAMAMIFYRPKMDDLEKLAIILREKTQQKQ